MQLYSRDDVWPALRAQLSVWEAIQRGFTPMLPQHRGGQNPLQENAPVLSGFPRKRQTSSLSCFALSSDAQSFLAWQASQSETDSASAALGSLPLQQQELQLPKPLGRAPQFEDSDGDVGLLLSPLRMIKKSLQVPPLGRKLRLLRSQLPQLRLCP